MTGSLFPEVCPENKPLTLVCMEVRLVKVYLIRATFRGNHKDYFQASSMVSFGVIAKRRHSGGPYSYRLQKNATGDPREPWGSE